MQIDLGCAGCELRFPAPADTLAAGLLDQFSSEGPWTLLGDGETLEDRLFAVLEGHENELACPRCGLPVVGDEEGLGRLSLELLKQW